MNVRALVASAAISIASLAGTGTALAADSGQPTHHAPKWMTFMKATASDKRHFHVHGQCVLVLSDKPHGWIVCRNGELHKIPAQ